MSAITYSLHAYPVAELPVPAWECFFGRNESGFQTLMFYVWVAHGGGRTVVVDTGPPPDAGNFEALVSACQTIDPRSTMRRIHTLDQVFGQASLDPERIDCLLITQAITYSTGGLLERYFPRARVYVSRAGVLEFLTDNPGHPPRDAYFTEKTWLFLRRLLVEGRLVLTDGPVEVENGIWYETTGGHHPGSAAVKVTTPRGIVGILETAFLKDNVDSEIPIGVAENTALCRQAIRRYKRDCDEVLASHDNTLLDRYAGGVIA